MYKSCALFLFIALAVSTNLLKAQKIRLLQEGKPTSIRGLSVVNNKTAWISGSKGYIAITNDGGKTWNWQQVKGYEQADFRDIEAFSNKEAIIMSSGTPALILKTTDGGASWEVKYKNDDKAYFLDAMDFADKKHGFILGDPIGDKFLLLETNNGGDSWHTFKNQPKALPGEAAFAASGTCLRINDKGKIIIVTGGSVARCLKTSLVDTTWTATILPMVQGKDSQGAFSIANDFVIVGGDYAKNTMNENVACLSNIDGGIKNQYLKSDKFPAGYQSCVEYVNGSIYLSTGTSGSNITNDSGKTWAGLDSISYNVCRKAKHGSMILLAGDKGKIAIFKP